MATTTLPREISDGVRRPAWFERPGPSVVVLGLVLVGLLLLTDPMGFLSTDVGGKLATLEAMQRNGGLSPDLGYWADLADPDGSLYPMYSTAQVGDTWVNATTLPMLIVAYPLYVLGGATAAGLIPVLGTLATALGARSLARRLGHDGSLAFWVAGAASPATIYALDFWEHSAGLAAMIWAVVLVLDASQDNGRARSALVAGLLFGLAAAMRQEAIVYGFVSGAALGGRLLLSGRFLGAIARGGALAAGFGAAMAANAALEGWLIGDATRAGRSTGTAAAAAGDVGLRLQEAIITLASPFASADMLYLLLAAMTFGGLVELGRRSDREELELRPVALVLVAVIAIVVLDFVSGGLSFVPGLAATTPVAALAVTRVGRTADLRMVGIIALGSLPLVWAVQFTGGAGPQWGGRYILTSGTLLVVVATVTMQSPRAAETLRRVAFAGLAITLVGVAWTVQRSHSFADAMQELADRPEPALVFHDPHLAREGGVLVLDEQWLAATGADARAEAAVALDALGIDEIGFVEHDRGNDPRVLPGWTVIADERVPLISGLFLRVTTQVPIDR